MADKLASMRSNWDKFAVRFTETANKRMSVQCARQLHAHLQLDQGASSVLEVAAGAGLGSLDIARYLTAGDDGKRKKLTVTDFSPVMIGLARETLKPLVADGKIDVKIMEANALDLVDVPTASVDRYVSGLTLQLVPDADTMLREAHRVLTPDGLAGFTIWAKPENSGMFTINAAANAELGLQQSGEHNNFVLGKNLAALRTRFRAAGFPNVRIWPFQCVVESWSGAAFAEFHRQAFPLGEDEKELSDKRFEVVRRLADEWLASKGIPIGLETYIVLASKKEIQASSSRV